MGTLNFPCTTCGAMVSTIGTAPGAVPMCSACGRAFPQAMPAIPTAYQGGGARGGAAVAVVAVLVIFVLGAAFFTMTSVRGSLKREAMREAEAAVAAQATLTSSDRAEIARLADILSTGSEAEARAAWASLASWDARDHWGTFDVLSVSYARAAHPHGVWWISNGLLRYYGARGEGVLVDGLVRWKENRELFEIACQSLEQYPSACERDSGPAAGREIADRALRVLSLARDKIDHPAASPRIDTARDRIHRAFPAEAR